MQAGSSTLPVIVKGGDFIQLSILYYPLCTTDKKSFINDTVPEE